MKSTAVLSNHVRSSADIATVNTAPPQEVSDTLFTVNSATGHTLTTIFESFLGRLLPSQGLILFDETGQLLQSNAMAREFCRLIWDSTTEQPVIFQETQLLPDQISALCAFLVDSWSEFPDQASQLQLWDEIFLDTGLRLSLSAEWIVLDGPCILVRLEDMTQSAGRRALGDACRYHLTPRETEVWALFLQGLSYQAVGEKLFIGLNTVKKHMKSIHSKRRGEFI